MKEKELRVALSEGVSSWLRFEHHAGREELFSERYLALPIGQILQHCLTGKVFAEDQHPTLATTGKVGRPPQLDFVVKNSAGKVTLVVESKWAANAGVSIVDVIWDCIRLELAANYYNCEAVFILAGTRERVDAVLKSKSFSTTNSRLERTNILELHGSGKSSVKINSFENGYAVRLHKIFRNYPNILWPSELNCGSGTQIPNASTANSYTAVVWHISPASKQKRRPFQPLSEDDTKARRKKTIAAIRKKLAAKAQAKRQSK